MSDKFYYRNFSETKTKVKGDKNGYKVQCDSILNIGDLIEECPVVNFELGQIAGNFICYRQDNDYNAVYNYDDVFSVATIRAVKEIGRGEEIVLPNKSRVIEKKGCNCGKAKGPAVFKPSRSGPSKILKETEVLEPTEQNTKFKSMVDGQELKTIKVDS